MSYDPAKHHRRSNRLKGYDYSRAGAYFITICTHQRQCLFGEIIDREMQLNQYGDAIANEWQKSASIRKEIELDMWVIMPNHFHGIVIITNNENPVGANGHSPLPNHSTLTNHSSLPRMKPRSISSLMTGFKSATTKHINILRDSPGTPVWQRNYYDHIIRDEESLNKIRQYVFNNPLSWEVDQLHPNNPSKW
jgi:putative transposase